MPNMLSSFLQPLIDLLYQLSSVLPTPWFTFIGSFVEELIAPIPSPLVMTLSGSLAASQQQPITYLFLLAMIGAVGKTIGSYLIYIAADRAEDLVMRRLGKFIGITHKEVEAIGKHLNKGWRDDIVLFLLRAIPIIPTAPVSVVSGLIKVKMRTYLVSTLLGTFVRNLLYLYLGFTTVGALESVNQGLDSFESIGYVVIFLLLLIPVGYIILHKRRGGQMNFLDSLLRHPDKK